MKVEKFTVIGTRSIKSKKSEFKIAYLVSKNDLTDTGEGKLTTQCFVDNSCKVGNVLNMLYVRELNKYVLVTE